MALTFANVYNTVLEFIDRGETEDITSVKRYVNMAYRDVWNARPWRERVKETTVETVAPYSTGTVTATEDSTTVTGSGTTFPTGAAARKFALGYASPWYTISTRDSATQLTLSDAYAEDTTSGASYVVYQDVVELATDFQAMVDVRIHWTLYPSRLAWLTRRRMDDAWIPTVAGVPTAYSLIEDKSDGTRRMRLWPVPDDTYRVTYRYLSRINSDLSSDSDEMALDDSRRDLVIWRALEMAYLLVGEPQNAALSAAKYERELSRLWSAEQAKQPASGRMGRFDAIGRGWRLPFNLPMEE